MTAGSKLLEMIDDGNVDIGSILQEGREGRVFSAKLSQWTLERLVYWWS